MKQQTYCFFSRKFQVQFESIGCENLLREVRRQETETLKLFRILDDAVIAVQEEVRTRAPEPTIAQKIAYFRVG